MKIFKKQKFFIDILITILLIIGYKQKKLKKVINYIINLMFETKYIQNINIKV